MARLAFLLALLLLALAPSASAAPAPFDVKVAMTEKWEKPQEVVVFPATLTSRAGQEIRVEFEVAKKEGDLLVVVPNPITLSPGARADIPLTIQTPYRNGHISEEGSATYRMQAKHPGTGAALGEPEELRVIVHTKGFYVPGVQLFGAMLALGIAALAFRRRA